MSESELEQPDQENLSRDAIIETLEEKGCIIHENSGLKPPEMDRERLETIFGDNLKAVEKGPLSQIISFLEKIPIEDDHGEDYEARFAWVEEFPPEAADFYRTQNQLRTNVLGAVAGNFGALAMVSKDPEISEKLKKFSDKYVKLTQDLPQTGSDETIPSEYAKLSNGGKIAFVGIFERDIVETLGLFSKNEKVPLRATVAEKVFDDSWRWNDRGIRDFPSQAKYAFEGNKNGRKLKPEQGRDLLRGILRGLVAERISGAVPFSSAETVYSTVAEEDMEGIEIRDIGAVFKDPSKQRLLRASVKNGLAKWPLKGEYPYDSEDDRSDAEKRQELEDEIALGYGGNQKGIFYEESTMPDALLADLRGSVEVKAYELHEIATWIDALDERGLTITASDEELREHGGIFQPHPAGRINLGADILGEIKFVDNLRAGYIDDEPLGLEESIVVLRFPSNARLNGRKRG